MRHATPKPARSMQGISMVELMIAMVLGLLVLAGLASLFASSSAARGELERSSRQIENGRFAMEILADDLRLAGFYGELNVRSIAAPGALPDPCSVAVAVWEAAIPIAVQGYDNGAAMPAGCAPADLKANTDILVVRRTASCQVGAVGCDALEASRPYFQVSKCSPENATTAYVIGMQGAAFPLRLKNCTTVSGLRRYFVRIYYISTDNGAGQAIPTLKRLDFNGAGFDSPATPLVEGIEELNIEYGIDWDGDGNPNDYNTDPSTFVPAGCATCTPVNNWFNVVTARINLLARNIDPSPRYTDIKTYTLGRNAAGGEVTVTPGPEVTVLDGGGYRRHAYTGLVRVVNVAQRKEAPP